MTKQQVLDMTAAIEYVSRNATHPRRHPSTPDVLLPVYRSVMARRSDMPRGVLRRIECGAANGSRNDVWVWCGKKVEARIDLRAADADERLAVYIPV